MRRRFGRRRRGEDGPKGLDVPRELARIAEEGAAPVGVLTPAAEDEVPAILAAVGTGEDRDGNRCVVAFSPESGAASWLGGLSVALRLAQDEGFRGRVYALSPRWRAPARALLGAIKSAPFELRALAIATEGGDAAWVEIETGHQVAVSLDLLGGAPDHPRSALQNRAAEALRGLAAKHGGVIQRDASGLRLVLMGQPVAALRHAGDAAELELLRPRRERIALPPDSLSEGFDQLEGSLRKLLADRKHREGEAGLRSREGAAFGRALELETPMLWPVGWGDQCPIDVLGTAADGRVTAGAVRRELDLVSLLPILEAAVYLDPVTAWLIPGARPSEAALSVRVAVAAERCGAPAERVLHALAPAGRLYDLSARGRGPVRYTLREAGETVAPAAHSAPEFRTPVGPRDAPPAVAPTARETPAENLGASETGASGEPRSAARTGGATDDSKRVRRFEEMSLFDLSEDEDNGADGGGRRRRRRGGRGRNRNGSGQSAEGQSERVTEPSDASPEPEEESTPARRPRRRRRRRRTRPLMVEDLADEEVDEEEEQSLAVSATDGDADEADDEDFDAVVADETDDSDDDDDEGEEDVDALEEEATSAAQEVPTAERAQARAPRPVRRRAAVVAHADPISIGAAVLLARDLRLIDGIWIYRQEDLMTFFRSVATDLSENTSIHLIGFTASPVRETLQTASLYGDRITWFDHHPWPPEDADALARAIGSESVKLAPGCGSSLPLVAEECTRRSRFSDKLLDLLTGRFSPHDYERWGRLWWWRLVELAGQTGERRRDLDALLTGRPSDLAREAAKRPAPPLPPEAEFVAAHDLPLVHFGGYTMLRILAPAHLDLLLAARIARERYGAQLAIGAHQGDRVVVLVGDDASGRRGFDLAAMAEHLAAKFSWIEPLPGADHVTRFRVVDLIERPERIEEIVAEVAMGRSVLEG